jgi:hypothetical protein
MFELYVASVAQEVRNKVLLFFFLLPPLTFFFITFDHSSYLKKCSNI